MANAFFYAGCFAVFDFQILNFVSKSVKKKYLSVLRLYCAAVSIWPYL